MINLMPPEIKSQIQYAKLNAQILRYLRVTVLVIAVLGGIMAWATWIIGRQTAQVSGDVASKQHTIAVLSQAFLPKAAAASQRLNAIKYVQATQTKFAEVVADIAKVVPQGVSIDDMSLDGNSAKPMALQVSTTTYDEALAFRNALLTSPRIAGADISAITLTDTAPDYHFKATIVVGFKAGQAK